MRVDHRHADALPWVVIEPGRPDAAFATQRAALIYCQKRMENP